MQRRSQNTLAQTNQPAAVNRAPQLQNFQHTRVDQISNSAGLDPFRGDLTNAFNQFFGQVQDSIGNLQAASFTKAKMAAEQEAKARRRAGAVDAYEMQDTGEYGKDADAALQNSGSAFKDQPGYSTAFQTAFGSATASELWADFEIASANVSPGNFESWSEGWWEKNYGNGTGNDIVDLEIQSAFNRNFDNKRVTMSRKAVEQSRSAALQAAGNSAYNYVSQAGGWGYDEYNQLLTQVQGVNPTMTQGKARTATLDLLAAASVAQGQTGIQNFLSFLDMQDNTVAFAPDGSINRQQSQSLSERFPMDIAQMRQRMYGLQQQYVTAGGVEAVSRFNSTLSSVLANSEGQTVQRVTALQNMQADLGALANTPGVNMSMLATAKAALSSEIAEAGNKTTGFAQLVQMADGGGVHAAMNAERAKELLPQLMGEEFYNFLNPTARPGTAQRAGEMIGSVISQYGYGAVDDDVREMIKAGLRSDDPTLQKASTDVIRQFAGENMATALQLFSDDAEFSRMVAIGSDESVTIAVNNANNPELIAAREQILSTGVAESLYPNAKTEDQNTNYLALQSKIAEEVEERFELDNGFMFFGNGGTPNLTPSASTHMHNVIAEETARLRSRGLAVDEAQLTKNVAAVLANTLVINDGRLEPLRDVPANQIPIGNNVPRRDGSGGFENVIDNMNRAADSIYVGLPRLTVGGVEIDDDEDLTIIYNAQLSVGEGNLYQVVSKENGRPLHLPVGMEIDGSQQYQESGEPYQWWNWNDNEGLSFQLTGNLEADQLLLKRFVHPGIRLVPQGADPMNEGAPTSYFVGVEPHFNNYDGEYMTLQELERLANL